VIDRLLGAGGMGEVYRARDARLERFVALKVLKIAPSDDEERRRRFAQEAKAVSALNHPNIVTIYDIADEGQVALIAMEYVDGKTLAELITGRGLSLTETLHYAIQAAGALAKAHEAGIIHRDLKPSNVMITHDGLVKIVDFGVAKLAPHGFDNSTGDTATDPLVTRSGSVVGTAAYMSPEQAEGKTVDPRSDIFSFGAVLYEMVTGVRVFAGATTISTLAAVLNKNPIPPSHLAHAIPHDLEKIILRCLQKDPARRLQVMSDLAVELQEVALEVGSEKAASGGQVDASGRPNVKAWLAIVTVALISAGGWIFWRDAIVPADEPTILPLTTFPGDERLPTFSPDGTQIAFVWSGEKRDNSDIYVKSIGGGAALRITTDPADDTAPAWSPDGSRIAFVRRQGRSAAVYLTPPVPGSETKRADFRPNNFNQATFVGQIATISWFPDGKWLAVPAQDTDGVTNGILAIPVDGREPRRLTWSTGLKYHFPVVSPDGTILAYAGCVTDSSCEIYLLRLGSDLEPRGPARAITHQRAGIQGLAWAADGHAVVYGSRLNGQHLWRVSISGDVPDKIELAGTPAVYPAISRRGDRLAFIRQGSGDSDLWKFEAGRPPESFLSSTLSDYGPQWSPDGKRIAFASDRSGRGPQIWVADSDGAKIVAVTEVSGRPQGTPRWSPDSRWIAYDASDQEGNSHVYIVESVGGTSRRLTSEPGVEQLPSWSRDGKSVYYRSSSGNWAIWRAPVAVGPPQRMTSPGARPTGAWESWDGSTLYFTRSGMLFGKPVAGGPETVVLPSVYQWDFFPVKGGIYYIRQPDASDRYSLELRYFDLPSKKDTVLNSFQSQESNGLSVSPDRKTVLYSGVRMSAGDDLMLIEHFR
jgi:serine/threonine protein kinase